MEALLKTRRYLRRCLSRYSKDAENVVDKTRAHVLTEGLEKTYSQFKDNHELIVIESSDEDFNSYQDEFEEITRTYEGTLGALRKLTENMTSRVSLSSTGSQGAEVRLPQLDLPVFRGSVTDWPSFVDLFNSAVGGNTHLAPSQKLQYLKAAMRGDAANILRHLPTTDAAYEEAWTLLRTRYENTREIINGHLDRLYNHEDERGSPAFLRSLLDCVNECKNALSLMQASAEDAFFNFIVTKKLSLETKRAWELSLEDDKIPSTSDLTKFLEQRARVYLTTDKVPRTNLSNTQPQRCPVCGVNHPVQSCERFKALSQREKEAFVRSAKLCYNCLGSGHNVGKCTARQCKRCDKRHHTLLHKEAPVPSNLSNNSNSKMLLATALVKIADNKGGSLKVRALLDMGSTISFITEELAEKLQLKRHPTELSWTGVGESDPQTARTYVNISGSSLVERFQFKTRAFLTGAVTSNQPLQNIQNSDKWRHIQGLKLADPLFYKSGKIDMLLGVDVLQSAIRNGIRRETNKPTAHRTAFGWVLFGKVPEGIQGTEHSLCVYPTLEQQVQRFWETENAAREPLLSGEEKECEAFFQRTWSRESNGRYVVKLPFKDDCLPGVNRGVAYNRFLSLERKFRKNKEFKNEYQAVIHDFQERGHLQPAKEECSTGVTYLPHHAVVKEESLTTKLRVVFDASAKTTNCLSLNDSLLNGPKLQDDLFDILLRFRRHNIVFTADIEKMYRQIKVHDDDINYQRILWREQEGDPIRDFCLTTVTFGVKPAPYLATRILHQLAADEEKRFPLGSGILRKDFYVDDLLSGCDELEEAQVTCKQLDELLLAGGFTLRKWASNNPEALQEVPIGRRALSEAEFNIDEGEFVKTLGLKWNPRTDCFCYKIVDLTTGAPTKRTVLSDICRTFDPLGWLSPFTIRGKILFQDLWKESLGWDDKIPNHLVTQWANYKIEANEIPKIVVPRKVVASEATERILCGFADASEKAYAAVVYLKCVTSTGKVTTKLLAAKTRVAPLKLTTIPRLELNAALLLARLMKRVAENFPIQNMTAWTDSTVVLAWIRNDPAKWKPYVAHRVTAIQEIIKREMWNHIQSEDNPADCASRGIGSRELKNHELWWNGPQLLLQGSPTNYPEPQPAAEEIQREARREKTNVFHVNYETTLLTESLKGFSSFSRLLRVTAYMRRFIFRCKKLQLENQTLQPNCREMRAAENLWIRVMQTEHFPEEINVLKKGGVLSNSSKIVCLDPFLDEEGLLRVGGRLHNAPIGYEQKHPLLLSKDSHFTALLIRHYHILHCHGGVTFLLAALRRRYWIVNGRSVVRKIIMECLPCHRWKAKGESQKMANLPPSRVSPKPAFNTCGVDYAGPITLKSMTGRKGTHKGYIAVFICFTTKAIHLELVSSLTTQAFIAALRRFVSRRGLCYTIYSDCGTNFTGANKELRQMLKIAKEETRNTDVAKTLSEQGIDWRFNPPGAPHFGGLWEAGVKSVKTHLRRVTGNAVLNFEEMTTVLTQIEACLNSRPLCELSTDPSDFDALTPGHFLIGRPLTAIPEPDLTGVLENRLANFQFCQKLVQNFWKRWSTEYLSRLQNRPKWLSPKSNLYVGQLVLIKEENISPLRWKMGRITALHPGTDGLVRVVTIQTAGGTKKRPVVKIAPLPIRTDNEKQD